MSSHIFDRVAWQRKDIFEQMGNIGVEVSRALKAKRAGDEQSLRGAFFRGLDLFDATVETWARRKSPRVREILRARELFVSSVTSKQEVAGLEEYFMHFAVTARLHK